MAKKTLTSDLSVKGINNLIDEIRKYQDSLVIKARLLAQELAELGVEIARVKVADYDAIFKGELIESIHSDYGESNKNGAIFFIKADSEHAIYVEIGTGIVGANSPYKGKLPVVYAQGKTIRQLPDGRYGWFYQGDDGNWYFTEGMPSRPFMYETSMELYSKVEEIAKKVFK